MSEKSYIENVFVEFYDRNAEIWRLDSQDYKILTDFYNKVSVGDQLTQNQGNFMLRLMSKYLPISIRNGFDYTEALQMPVWKTTFRRLDQTKEVFCEKDSDGLIWACFKFPYAFKNVFDTEVEGSSPSRTIWDADRKLRKLDLQKFNIIHLHEFATTHGFTIDESFAEVVSQAEEFWNEQENIIPYAALGNGSVRLKNALPDVESFWENTATGSLEKDMFLAKSMGYTVRLENPTTSLEKIVSSVYTNFWIKDISKFFELHKTIEATTAIVIDRNTTDVVSWLDTFVKNADLQGIPREDIKVCFRESENSTSKLNQWVKDNHVGGTVKDGKILIFQHRPAKWLFKDCDDVKIIATNSFTPMNEPLTSAWVSSHPCVCYLGDIKPTKVRDKKIVEL